MPYRALRDPDQIQALLDAVLSIESELELSEVLRRIAEAARTLTDATYAAIGVIDRAGTGLAEFVQVGLSGDQVAAIGHPPVGEGVLGLLILDPRPLRLSDLRAHPYSSGVPAGHPTMKSFLGVPLKIRDEVFGNVYLTDRKDGSDFSDEDEALVTALATAAGIAVHNARLHARVAEMGLAADRERIARDLHDTVIQRLFATGLSLQSVLPLADDADLHVPIEAAITALDDTIRQVRTTIFALEPPVATATGIRSRVLELCSQAAQSLGFEPEVRFVGAIDRFVGTKLAAELLATLQEALSNVVRHAQANHVEVYLEADGQVYLRVADDGVGMREATDIGAGEAGSASGRGLTNMAERSARFGGSLEVDTRPGGGTEVRWRVPVVL